MRFRKNIQPPAAAAGLAMILAAPCEARTKIPFFFFTSIGGSLWEGEATFVFQVKNGRAENVVMESFWCEKGDIDEKEVEQEVRRVFFE